ncbi:MAG: sugar transferase [Clostridia bacterium]|nr:sugar transferase [Clostridia bacterium]
MSIGRGRRGGVGRYGAVKRLLDIFFSFTLLALLFLPMALIWLVAGLDSKGSGIFRQTRIGRDGKPFVCYKFRTMYVSAPPCCPSSKLTDADRYITPTGRFLRRSSLDELPQLFNVLKGDMSLVGPRPLIAEETAVHELRMKSGVYRLRPGLTGLSQVRGRDRVTDERKAELDAMYLEEFGLMQDIRIIGETVGKVIRGEGVEE